MTPEEITSLFSYLEKIIFLLQTVAISTSACFSLLLVQLIIHSKNQKNLL